MKGSRAPSPKPKKHPVSEPVHPEFDKVYFQHLAYPTEAVEKGLEGSVELSLNFSAEGALIGSRVETSSGHPLLDAAALKTARRLPALQHYAGQILLFTVNFKLDN